MNKIISKISKVLKKKLESNYYEQVREIYHFFKYFKARNYNSLKDLKHNENLLKSFGFSTEKIKSQLNSLNYSYQSDRLSWHYHVFA